MKVFLDNLGTKKIVSPVKKISEFIEGDLIATDPKFLGSVVNAVNLVETEHKKVTNTPITGKTPWMKMILIFMMVGLGAGLLYYGYSSGAFNHLVPTIGGGAPSSSDLMKQYPDPASLKAAIASGKVKYDALPPDVQKMVDSTKP